MHSSGFTTSGKFNATLGASSCTETAALAQVLIDGYLYHFATSFLYFCFLLIYLNPHKAGSRKSMLEIFLRIDRVQSVFNIRIPITVHVHIYGDGLADILRIVPFGKELFKQILFACRICHGDTRPVGDFLEHLVSVAQLLDACFRCKVCVVDHACYLES